MTVTTASELTEVELLHYYLGLRIARGSKDITIEQALQDYSEYRRQLDDFRAKLREAEESSARGDSGPLDLEALMDRVRDRLELHGITE